MDFDLTDEHEAVVDLAATILGEHADPARLRQLEEGGGWLDEAAWQAITGSGLIAAVLPEPAGGGMGMLGLHLLLEQAGMTAAHVPLWEHAVGALALATFAPTDVDLDRVANGDDLVTLALMEVGAPAEAPTVVASDADGWRLTGTKVLVPLLDRTNHLLVSAATDDGQTGVFLVARDAVEATPQQLSSRVPHARTDLDRAPAVPVGPVAGTALEWLLQRARAGLASLQAGLNQGAVRLAADYTSTREQFGRPIATFQAVSQRVAQAFIEAECGRLTALQAAWSLDEDGTAPDEVAIAKWWASEAGHNVLHAAQHVHGGVGVDREYPLHRFLLRTKQIEFTLGAAPEHLAALGARVADDDA